MSENPASIRAASDDPCRALPRPPTDGRSAVEGKRDALVALLLEPGDLVVASDRDGRIIEANDAFRRVTGCADPVGRRFGDLGIDPMPAGAAAGTITTLKTAAGTRRYAWREITAVDAETGDAVVHALGRDVTIGLRAENELVEKRERAESASAAKSRFLAMVSHEVRTPLNGILGLTQLLAGTRLTAEQESYVDAVRHSGHALLTLIEDLLDFSSMEAGKFYLRPEAGDVRQLIGGVVELSAARADEKNIEIAAYVAPDVPETIVADHGRLRQILFNLVGNALKFTEKGGVFVEVGMDGDAVVFLVTDTGPGLDPADQARIFQEFEQVESDATRRNGGAGLGLAISARLVAAMEGSISVESAPGEGSTFMVSIPSGIAGELPGGGRKEAGSLARSRVLLIAPPGPTERALLRVVRDHGGAAASACDIASAEKAITLLNGSLTDVIVDNRLAHEAKEIVAGINVNPASDFRRTMMVTPADRQALTAARAQDFAAWLIRPLRLSSLVKVLNRETGGLGTWLEEREGFPDPSPRKTELRDDTRDRRLSILLAEDNPVNALLVRSALQRAGHSVVHVTNGRDLVEKACDREQALSAFDAVLTDLSMPLLDGIGAIKAIRAFERDRGLTGLPIIVLSADGQNQSRIEAIDSGAGDYVEKPVDPDVLLQAIERAAARSLLPAG